MGSWGSEVSLLSVPELLQKSGCHPCHNLVFNIDAFSFCLVVTLVLTEVKICSEDRLLTALLFRAWLFIWIGTATYIHLYISA